MTRRRNHTRKGFNLIESAIVLGVVGFVIGGIWTAASSVRANSEFNDVKAGILWADSINQSQWSIMANDPNIPGNQGYTFPAITYGTYPGGFVGYDAGNPAWCCVLNRGKIVLIQSMNYENSIYLPNSSEVDVYFDMAGGTTNPPLCTRLIAWVISLNRKAYFRIYYNGYSSQLNFEHPTDPVPSMQQVSTMCETSQFIYIFFPR